jgi:predicted acylesterase/phospholipase RssA/CRP-like cAMP-binding protein
MGENTDFVVERLQEAPIFRAVGRAELENLAAEVEIVDLNAGATLTTQGEPADGAYLLVSGRLRAFAVQTDGSELPVGEIASGELVGEMALLSAARRNATVRAVRDSLLFFVKGKVFDRIVHTRPEATLAIARVLVERLGRANSGRPVTPPRRAVALVPAYGDPKAAVGALITEIGAMTELEVVDATRVEETLGPDHTEAELVHWLHRLEAKSRLIVYVADHHDTPWGHRCMRQADHILAIDTEPSSDGESRVIETLEALTVGAVGTTVAAIVVHPATRRMPVGGHRWVKSNHIRVHHVRADTSPDFARVARAVLRSDVAMVFSGGGARGMAHLGVIRAFAEQGIPIDVVGGTSFGAIMAVACAMDLGWEEMRDRLWEGVGRDGAPIDVTAPLLALSRGTRLLRVLETVFGDTCLEDTWLPCYCVSSNLSTGHPLIHTSGRAVTALRASVAIPGVFPPVATGDGEVLVDGGVMNNLPVDVMAGFSNGGPTIAVNLHSPVHMEAGDLPADGIVSGWALVWRRLHPLRDRARVPSVVEVLARSSEIGGSETARVMEQRADFVLHPPTGDHALLDFQALDDLQRLGYEYTMAEIEGWRAAGRTLPV